MSISPLVAITDYLTDADVEGPVLDGVADVRALRLTDERELIRVASEAEALLVYHEIRLTAVAFAEMPRLRGVIRVGVGFDNVDRQEAGAQGIVVCNVPDYGVEDVADHAVMLLLAVARRLGPAVHSVRSGVWDPAVVHGTPRLRGRTLGVIGCGRIGTAMAMRSKALGMRVVMYDPYQPAGIEKSLGIEREWSLHALLRRSEFLTLHCPLTEETDGMLDREEFSLLPEGAYLINVARGPCVRTEAVLEALESGRLAGAGLDVLEREPLDDDRLRQHPRVLVTPHSAFYTVEGFTEMRQKAAEEARRMLTNEPVRNPVNLAWLKNPRCAVPARLDG